MVSSGFPLEPSGNGGFAEVREYFFRSKLQGIDPKKSNHKRFDHGYAFSGRINSGKYLDGAQTFTVKLRQPRMRNSRMMRM
jgi:hypothetical protein